METRIYPAMKSHDYSQRGGNEEITWEVFAQLSRTQVEELSDTGIEAVVGIGRAGLVPAAVVASALRRELHPVRVTRWSSSRGTTTSIWTADGYFTRN